MSKERVLGSEWKNWDGKNENSDATIGLFLLLSFIVMAIFSLILLFGKYLVHPRLQSINPLLPVIVQTFILVTIGMMILWMILMSLSMFLNINLLFGIDKKIFNIFSLFPHTQKLAKRFGINKDRLANSFIKMNNQIVKLRSHTFSPCDIMVLIPRCLSNEILTKISEITKKYEINYYIVHGGEAAREIVQSKRPKAIVAVACERDLVAGIKDVSKVFVLGLPNSRPEGPCKNTIINLDEFERQIRLFLGYRV
jgi:uncharacterized protein